MKRFAIIGAGALVLLLLLLGTGSVAFYSQESNCVKCHEMEKDYRSWQMSSHNHVACESCHARTTASFSIQGTAMGRIIAHFTKKDKNPKAYVSKENCLRCHAGIKKNIKTLRDSHIVNPHPIHLAAGFDCSHCHKRVAHADGVNTPSRPQMKDCINCHRAKEVSTECKTCHYGTQEHLDIIAQAGGYVLKEGEGCEVCHTEKDVDKPDHGKAMQNIGGYTGSETCLKCHVNAAKQIGSSAHGMLKTKVAHVPGIKVPMGMASKAVNPMALNLWASLTPLKDGTMKSGTCGNCHVGGSNLPTPEMAAPVDCLVCHAEKYDFSKRHVEKVGNVFKWNYEQGPEVAASVGKPKAEYCYRCHEDHMAETRGTKYEPEADVHAEAGMSCQSCHVTISHKIAKGNVADLMANDIPELSVSCTSCHVDFKHENKNIDTHLSRLACQTCHIGKVGGYWVQDKTKGQDDNNDGVFEDTKVHKEGYPTYFWFNGTATDKNLPVGSRTDKKAKIFPFKVITVISGVDPNTKLPVASAAGVYSKTGDFAAAVKAAAASKGLPEPKWIPLKSNKVQQLDHQIQKIGVKCNDCHAKKGIMDFKALGYTDQEIEELTQPQNY
ncbi:MAG: hypothetical protein K6T91_05640 [Firmicutes bacterium]|nr:hypothetical protein [Bacillota bacterium]